MLRYDSPVTETARMPMEDREISGCPMTTGESVVPMLHAANHDPDVYPEPHRFDITREDTHHHSFGGGAHFCLGAPLARVDAHMVVFRRRRFLLNFLRDVLPFLSGAEEFVCFALTIVGQVSM